jgi:hypothetical protein
MKRRVMIAMAAVAVAALLFGVHHNVFAAERTMVIKVPGCV